MTTLPAPHDPDMTARQRLDALADLLAESLRRQQDEAKAAARTARESA